MVVWVRENVESGGACTYIELMPRNAVVPAN